MNLLDIIILTVAAVGAVSGLYTGLVKQLGSLLGVVLGLIGARIWASDVYNLIKPFVDADETVMHGVAWVITFVAIVFFVGLLASLVTKTLEIAMLGCVNKLLGAIFGGIKYILLFSILLNGAALLDAYIEIPSKKTRNDSVLYAPVKEVASHAMSYIKDKNLSWDMIKELDLKNLTKEL